MKEKKTVTEIVLPGVDRPAVLTCERLGQQSPGEGDQVVVMGRLSLPADEGSQVLCAEIRFHNRVVVMGSSLGYHWGKKSEESRYITSSAEAKTWAAAMAKMSARLRKEAHILVAALEARQQALIDAEGDETDETE